MAVSAAVVVAVAVTAINDATLLLANRARRGAYIFNGAGEDLYVKFGESATVDLFTVKIPPGGFWEFPGLPVYTGLVTGIFSSGSGDVMVTELYG